MNRHNPLSPKQLWTGERIVPGVEGGVRLEHLHRYAIAAGLAEDKDVLDVGCGEGYGPMLLAERARSVVGMDNSQEVIDHARQCYQAKNLRYEKGQCHEIPLPDASMDVVISFETVQFILQHDAFLTEVRRVLRPGGVLLFSCPNRDFKPMHKQEEKMFYLREFSQEELGELVGRHFSHAGWMVQRVSYGSIAHGLTGNPSQDGGALVSYAGDFREVQAGRDFEAAGFLVLCSDQDLPVLGNSVFEDPAELERLRGLASSIQAPLLRRVQELELRISRMECSTWWRLRRPLRFLADMILQRPPSGMFTPQKSRMTPARSSGKTASRPAGQQASGLWNQDGVAGPAIPLPREITVVVPTYNHFEELQLCLASILRYTSVKHRVFVMDDCSTDVRVWPMLIRLAAQYPQVVLDRNTINRGYSATLNLALSRYPASDIVLVNSSVQVTKKWLHKLSLCAMRRPGVATVSPLVNRPGPFEIDLRAQGGGLPPSFNAMDIAETVEKCAGRLHPEAPTMNHACCYIRRDALDRVGGFDEKNFPYGYGEEMDFAERASAAGFVHLIEDTLFVFQKPAPGMADHRKRLSEQGRQKLESLHPEMQQKLDDWMRRDPLAKMRKATREAITLRSARIHGMHRKETRKRNSQAVLFIVQESQGGTVLTSEDLIQGVALSRPCYLLRTSFNQWSLYRCEEGNLHLLQRLDFARPWSIDAELDEERSLAVDQILQQFAFGVVHIRHFLGCAPEIVHRIKRHNLPVVFSFHDFYTVCPTIQLLDNNKKFCGGTCTPPVPGEQEVAEPVDIAGARNGSPNGSTACVDCCLPSIWPLVTLSQQLKHRYVYDWRKRTRLALEKCDGFVTTSKFTARVLMQHFEFLRRKDFRTIEHGRDFSHFGFVGAPPAEGKVRIIFFGSLQISKGSELLGQIMRLDRAGGKRLEVHILGAITRNGFDPRRLGAIYHGRYRREQLVEKVGQIKPSFAIIPSIWPETFCHTLTESWALGLPVFASDIGTLSQRVRDHGGGWLIDPASPEAWYQAILRAIDDPQDYERKMQAIRERPLKSISQMTGEYIDLYDSAMRDQKRAD